MSAAEPQRSLTPAEVNKIKHCAEAIRIGQDLFSCGGVLTGKDVDFDQLYLKYTDSFQPDESFTTRPVPLTEEIIGKLARAGNIAPFGKGSETVVDESYRLARAIAIPDFALVPDPALGSGLLTTIAAHLGLKYPLTARLAKLNIYPQGGFFKAHQDTARGENHLGTITLCLPSSFTGGDLVVRKGDREIVYDWSTDVWGASGNPQLPWAFLYADVEHEVLPVTSGMRVTAAWDVFTIPDSGTQISYDVLNSAAARTRDASKEYIRQAILAMFDDMSFVPEGAILGFGFSHSYPIEGQEWSKTSRQLKGTDAILVDIFEHAGIKFAWRFRYDNDEEFESWYNDMLEYDSKTLRKIIVEPVIDHPFKLDEFTSQEPGQLDGAYVEGSLTEELSTSGAKVRRDVMWVTYPGQSSRAGDYTAYGNEASTEFYYVAPCLFVTIPPAEKRLKEWHVVEAGQRAVNSKDAAGMGGA